MGGGKGEGVIRGGGCSRGRWFANLTQQLIIIALTSFPYPSTAVLVTTMFFTTTFQD
jgi:hypothetical protein